jgi:hypothetical protein
MVEYTKAAEHPTYFYDVDINPEYLTFYSVYCALLFQENNNRLLKFPTTLLRQNQNMKYLLDFLFDSDHTKVIHNLLTSYPQLIHN